ncbi:MAG: hypothetical protein M3N43_11160 [Actinomycetota bacterium]|nr:hypothetical protein [Actinomycetota bacterium]
MGRHSRRGPRAEQLTLHSRVDPVEAVNSASDPYLETPTDWIGRGCCLLLGALIGLGFALVEVPAPEPAQEVAVVSASVEAPPGSCRWADTEVLRARSSGTAKAAATGEK